MLFKGLETGGYECTTPKIHKPKIWYDNNAKLKSIGTIDKKQTDVQNICRIDAHIQEEYVHKKWELYFI